MNKLEYMKMVNDLLIDYHNGDIDEIQFVGGMAMAGELRIQRIKQDTMIRDEIEDMIQGP